MNALLGVILVTTASWQILYSFRPMKQHGPPDRSPVLPWLMFPVGAEVGFSSAGAGALGSAALLSLTTLLPAQVVGTDIAFGFVISLIGSGAHWFSHASDPSLLIHLIVGGVAGSVVGTILSTHIPRRPLRFALCVWLLILAVNSSSTATTFGLQRDGASLQARIPSAIIRQEHLHSSSNQGNSISLIPLLISPARLWRLPFQFLLRQFVQNIGRPVRQLARLLTC